MNAAATTVRTTRAKAPARAGWWAALRDGFTRGEQEAVSSQRFQSYVSGNSGIADRSTHER